MTMWDKLREASQQYLDGLIDEGELQVKLATTLASEPWCAGDRVIVTELAKFIAWE